MFKKKAKSNAVEIPEEITQEADNTISADDMFSDFETTVEGKDKQEESFSIPKIEEQPPKKAEKIKKKQLKNTADSNEEQPEQQKKDMILYIIVDKQVSGLLNYFRESGLKVSTIFDDISDAKNAILMQSEPTRIVIIDTGLGKFTTTTMRAELIDMLGISDEQNKTTVFYTDSVLKVDTIRALKKTQRNIEWLKYESTSIVAATLLSYSEAYVYDREDSDDVLESEKSILSFKGLTSSALEGQRFDISGFSSDAIVTHMSNEEAESLPGFEINL